MNEPLDDSALIRIQVVTKVYGDHFAGAVNQLAGEIARDRGCPDGRYTAKEVTQAVVRLQEQ
jgi:hypothetical protein